MRATPILLAGWLLVHGWSSAAGSVHSLQIADLLSPEHRRLKAELERTETLRTLCQVDQPSAQPTTRIGWHSRFAQTPDASKWLQIDLGAEREFEAIVLVPVEAENASERVKGFGFPRRFRVEASDDAAFSEPRLLAAHDAADFPNPGNTAVYLPTAGAKARYVRITVTRLWGQAGRYLCALGEVFVFQGERVLSAGARVEVSDAYNNPPAWEAANLVDGQTVLGPPVSGRASPANGWHAAVARQPDVEKWVQLDLGAELPLEEVRVFPARPRDFPSRPGFGFPLRFRIEAASQPDFADAAMLLDQTHSDFPNPGESPLIVAAEGKRARYVRMTATRLWQRSDDFIFALAEMEVYAGGRNVALGCTVTSLDSIEVGTWARERLVDGFNSEAQIVPLKEWLERSSHVREQAQALADEAESMRKRLRSIENQVEKTASRAGLGVAALLPLSIVGWSFARRRTRRREIESLRRRIASDLHDEIGSNLGSIALLSEMAQMQSRDGNGDLAEIHRIARETAQAMRDLVWMIDPDGERVDFASRLRETASTMLAGIEWAFEAPASLPPLPLAAKRHLLLFCKEALHNARRHGAAKRVMLRLVRTDGALELEIEDDGAGFEVDRPSDGHGLASMRARAAELRATFAIDSAPGKGTRISLHIPDAR